MHITKNAGSSDPSGPAGRVSPPLLEVIRGHPFFQGLQPRHLQLLAENALVMGYGRGQTIFRDGDPANRLYLVTKGQVALESPLQNKPAIRIQTLGAGDVLGWSWLFPPYYWHFDACVLEPTTTVYFYGGRLREHCESDRDLGYELMKRSVEMVINRLQATRRQLLRSGRTPG
jgi:CRP-like cAMP-binding protein